MVNLMYLIIVKENNYKVLNIFVKLFAKKLLMLMIREDLSSQNQLTIFMATLSMFINVFQIFKVSK